MKKQLLLLIALLAIATGARADVAINTTIFPDQAFREYLLDQDYGKDGKLTNSEIAAITELDVSARGIKELKGIEHFTALTELNCTYNQLTALDLSKNTRLTTLSCGDNQLTKLDVSKNTALTSLYCTVNRLSDLDVSKNTKLSVLHCYRNQIKADKMAALVASLPKNETRTKYNLYVLDSYDEKNTFNVSLAKDARARGWMPYRFSDDDSQWEPYSVRVADIKPENFPDAAFRSYLLAQDYGKDGVLTDIEIEGVTKMDVKGKNIKSLKGIGFFTALAILHCERNQIKGDDMLDLVLSLPKNTTTKEYQFYVKGFSNDEGNVCTRTHVKIAKALGWTAYCYDSDGSGWSYTGSQPAKKGDVNDDGTVDVADISNVIDIMAGKDVEGQPEEKVYTACPDENHPHWIDMGLPSGTQWQCCNEGASKPEEYGGYYTFGEIASAPAWNQLYELWNKCTSEWTTLNGVNGQKFTGANGGTIFLPASGRFSDMGGNWLAGSECLYWSSSQQENNPDYAWYLAIASEYMNINGSKRYERQSVRPVR